MKNKIKKLIKKYPNFFIYYHDNGSWCMYESKKDVDVKTGEVFHDPILEGDDFGIDSNGYCPVIVAALVESLGGSTFSI